MACSRTSPGSAREASTWRSTGDSSQAEAAALLERNRAHQALGECDPAGETVGDAAHGRLRPAPEKLQERAREVGGDVHVEFGLSHGRHDEARHRGAARQLLPPDMDVTTDRKSTRLNSS